MTERGWEAVTFEGVRRAQLHEQMRLTPAERLRWLEEALELVARLQAERGRRESPDPDSPRSNSE
jgi:hypothetical protein